MDYTMAYNIINEGARLGVNAIKFNFRGESTMHPQYRSITAMAKAMATGNTYVDRLANSNFKISPKVREDKFLGLANLTKVKISYDSFDKKVFETQRAKGNHDLTTENIDLFYNHKARIKSETQLVIQAVRTKLNKDEDIEGIAKLRWPEASISIRDMVEGRVDKDLEDLTDRKRDLTHRQSCIQAHVRMIIHHDGRVGPCCPATGNDLFIGKYPDNTVKEIFNSKDSKQLRKDLKSKKAFELDPCKTCSSFESYKDFKPNWDS
jgi:radical SAM protein with 4Fe4S-binding SPASM domain